MSDQELRQLERDAARDPIAAQRLCAARVRAGLVAPRDGWRHMTNHEVRMARALGVCRFSPGSVDKRIARDLHRQAREQPPEITAKQARLLLKKVERYRRQIPDDVVELARLHRPCCTCMEPFQVSGHADWCAPPPDPMPLFDGGAP